MKVYLLFFLTVFSLCATAQTGDESEQIIEKYIENFEFNGDLSQVHEDLVNYMTKPINLNYAGLEELLNFPILSHAGTIAIVNHRLKYGLFLDITELQVAGFSPDDIRKLIPFVTINKKIQNKMEDLVFQLGDGKMYAVSTLKYRSPIAIPEGSLGNNYAQNLRIRYYKPGVYSMGFSADKDAGERYWNKGPDFFSGHVSVHNFGKVKNLVIGDYLLSFGQGLVLGSGIGTGKSALVLNTKRNAPVLKPYSGTNEFLFHRGVALTAEFGKYEFTAAFSRNLLDTRLGQDSGFSGMSFSTVYLDGYHRTESEISNKGNTERTMIGGWIMRKNKSGFWGFGSSNFVYNKEISTSENLYKLHFPGGKTLNFLNLFQAHTIGRLHFFSEWACLAENNAKSGVLGILTSLGKALELSVLWRNYNPGFHSPFSTSFGNNYQNESGVYAGLKIRLHPKCVLSHFIDFWKNPWLNYRIWAPAQGKEMFWQVDYSPKKRTQVYLRIRSIDRPFAMNATQLSKVVAQNEIQSLRMHFSSVLSNHLTLQVRGEMATSNIERERRTSSLIFVQISKNMKKSRLVVRYSIFEVPFYYNRMFAYESQLPFEYGTMSFYGQGQSAYVILQCKLTRHWKIGLRTAWNQTISSGEKNANSGYAIHVQVMYGS